MKTRFKILAVCFLISVSCDEFGGDKNHPMSSSQRYHFSEGDVLSYESDTSTEQYEVMRIVNGTYSDSRSGTCGKPKLDVYEYQVIHIKPGDSLNRSYYYAPDHTDDCRRYPDLNKQLICSINGSYQEDTAARLMWINEFAG